MGPDDTILDGPKLTNYKKDMADFEATPLVVVRPRLEEQIPQIVKIANRYNLKLVPWGAGTSLTGAVVLEGGIVIDMRYLNKILKVDLVNWNVLVQPGMILDDLNKELKRSGFFFPPDPASSFACTVGGAVSEGSGGMRCVKYGTMRDWVLALKVVLPNGKTTWLGEPLPKNRAGYNLVHLFIGSEGTLGIITQAYLKIIPLPTVPVRRLVVLFDDWASASKAILAFRTSRIVPTIMEFMDRENVMAVNQAFQTKWDEAEATLLVDIDEPNVERASRIFRDSGARKITIAKDEKEAEELYQARAQALVALKSISTGTRPEDVVVPINKLVEYLDLVRRVASKYKLKIPVVGHAGDGNVHPVILFDKNDAASTKAAETAFEEICRYAIGVGGTITGEHGVGSEKAKLLVEQLTAHGGEEALRLMKVIKRGIDPKDLMNPGKYMDLGYDDHASSARSRNRRLGRERGETVR
ncbi:MAG: FAD-binding protein [Nitrososphaerota archaeon]|nr:FAD-binding protein [Nitrososphaerota archaeon]